MGTTVESDSASILLLMTIGMASRLHKVTPVRALFLAVLLAQLYEMGAYTFTSFAELSSCSHVNDTRVLRLVMGCKQKSQNVFILHFSTTLAECCYNQYAPFDLLAHETSLA